MSLFSKQRSVIPGFGLSFGFTMFYLSLIVLIPLSAVFIRTSGLSWGEFWNAAFNARELASYKVTFLSSFAAAGVNGIFGTILAWVLVRYPFPGRRVIDALVDLPFALPTAVAGISLTAIYSKNGWIGKWLDPEGVFFSVNQINLFGLKFEGIKVAYSALGIFVAMTFIGLPFVVRTLQPVIEELEPELEEAASTLGASRLQALYKVILPQLVPAVLTGFALAFARALGEYGSIVFISGNQPNKTEITPFRIITKLEESNAAGAAVPYATATAVAVVMLVASFVLLFLINLLQKWSRRHQEA
ncbi:MAG: sulfate ABC transporter permease subunit CysT [Puniceicoccales bacterium]|jgi:sulfate transport system permease protein|nr:sulfate ABC transporter permease subunit CysT [Puniceicoccales bacterium]